MLHIYILIKLCYELEQISVDTYCSYSVICVWTLDWGRPSPARLCR